MVNNDKDNSMIEKREKLLSEKLWAEYKYEVLSKCPRTYLQIREYLKNDFVEVAQVQFLISKAQELEENPFYVINASEHMWGYFKKVATNDEKEAFFALLEAYKKKEVNKQHIIQSFQKLLGKYPNAYLQNSSLLKTSNDSLYQNLN